MTDNLLFSFDYFCGMELFPHCTADEIKECIESNHLPDVLTLVHHIDRIRFLYRKPIRLTSTYRGVIHNRDCAGASTSQHLKGCAVDFQPCGNTIPAAEITALVKVILDYNENNPFISQLLVAPNYIHVGLLDTSSERLNHFSVKVYDKRWNKDVYDLFVERNYQFI